MKKTSSIMLSMMLCFGVSTTTAFAAEGSAHGEALKSMKQRTGEHFLINWKDAKKKDPSFVSGKLSEKPVKSVKDVKRYLKDHANLYKLDPNSELTFKGVKTDKLGMKHYDFVQTVDGVPVDNSRFTVHTNKKGTVKAVSGNALPSIDKKLDVRVKANINKKEALKKAWAHIQLSPKATKQAEKKVKKDSKVIVKTAKEAKLPKIDEKNTVESAKLVVYKHDGKAYLAYHTKLQFIYPNPGNWQIYVNAKDGSIIDAYNAVAYDGPASGGGYGVLGDYKPLNLYLSGGYYYLYDTTKPMNGVIETRTAQNGQTLPGPYLVDRDTNFNSNDEAAAVDANYYAGKVYDYYYNKFGRNSFDGNGSTLRSTVHYGYNYNNAFWNGQQMVYGDGDGRTFIPLSGSEDVIGHELTHAVTERTAGLEYHDQSGALNESMSDVFGVLITGDDYLIGEDVYTPGVSGDALRSLSNPERYGQPANMSDYVYTSSDNGGVHTNSGIPNKAGYLTINQLGLDKSSKIYYRALTHYLTPTAQFSDARAACLQAAADLYGYGTEYNAVASAWDQVGVN
ncbi:bacillolysin/thermolysin [Scopulibacillus darangshiensis]|uniref:Neutral metalloproteinase n=1 Tax=Scopulibacillus darangshiensis TaxID=442528 RepID=A0A4R2NG82_9BACL|nr:M4 family metallopeptidase [Scopulibacillus darangshiensis]TCP20290.1 bacillolysin/thermolysin [Scopulibacillus darangshiensis]